MKKKLNYKGIILAGLISFLINMMVGNALWMNPYVKGVFENFLGHPSLKPVEQMGGLSNFLLLTFGFGLILIIFFIYLYVVLYNGIPGTNWFNKGLFFGLMLASIKAVPESFNQWTVLNYPDILIIIQLINTIIILVLFGIYLAFFIKIFKGIQYEN